jgi:MFS family permease/cytidylate kinase
MTAVAAQRLHPQSNYRWVALSNTTVGILMANVNSSIVLISLPAIFRGIRIDPLEPANISYLLWMLMGYLVATAVLVVGFGRVGDMFGRVRMYNLGFAVFTVASIGLSLVFFSGPPAALTLIGLRLVQGVGGAMLMANSAAILTDAFPETQRGMALGINSVAGIAGSFVGLITGGLVSVFDWHLVFLVSVPVGLFGTAWAYRKLREVGTVRRARMDWWGNLTFGIGLVLVLVGITYGIQPYGGQDMGWTNPAVLGALGAGVLLLAAFAVIETRVPEPMFRIDLFKVPAFAAGNLAGLLASIGRGGLMFILIIWLQGIWLPLHGYSFEQTPLWAAIYMLPLTAGFLIAGPISGYLSDRYGARPFATGGMLTAAATFGLMLLLPADFAYTPFALLLLGNGLGMGMFLSPNSAGIMNSVPPGQRGVSSGMRATFQNAGMNLSIGLFFSLMIVGLSRALPAVLYRGLTVQGVPAAVAARISHLPPVSMLFAAFLGYNPIQSLLGPVLGRLPPDRAAYLTGKTFFPELISGPFMDGLHLTFSFALAMMLVAAGASWLRGKRYVYAVEEAAPVPSRPRPAPVVAISATYGAGGSEVGQAAARLLDVPFVDAAIPSTVAERLAVPLEHVMAHDERREASVRTLLSDLYSFSPLFGVDGLRQGEPLNDEEAYRRRIEDVTRELATRGGVILGHGATAILRSDPHTLLVLLEGPLERRVERLMGDEHLDRETARRRLQAADRMRQSYMRHFYDVDVNDPALYHLRIGSTALPALTCAEMIAAGARALAFQASRPDHLPAEQPAKERPGRK